MRPQLIVLALSALLASCVTQPVSCGGAEAAKAVLRDVIAADNDRNLERVLSFYTDDVAWVPPGGQARLEGLPAIRESYLRMYAQFAPAITVTTETAIATETRAIVQGHTAGQLHPVAGGNDVVVHDNYRATLRCEGARWRISELAWGAAAS